MKHINELNNYSLLSEMFEIFEAKNGDVILSPRFSPKNKSHRVFKDWPVKKWKNFDTRMFYDAIQMGMILEIEYETEDAYTERKIQPMVMGKNKDGDILIRAFHLKGESDSLGDAKKVWRLFKAERINKARFLGKFFRTTPDNYVSKDSAMKGGITIAADIDTIRDNQEQLVEG